MVKNESDWKKIPLVQLSFSICGPRPSENGQTQWQKTLYMHGMSSLIHFGRSDVTWNDRKCAHETHLEVPNVIYNKTPSKQIIPNMRLTIERKRKFTSLRNADKTD